MISPLSLQQAADFLANLDDDWARAVAEVGACGHRSQASREPFEALVRAVAYQQIHARAAEAILDRLLQHFPEVPFPSPRQLLELGHEPLRACGFSATKARSILGIAQATSEGVVPTLAAARSLSDEELIARLTSLYGVGRWTVEMLLIFSLERLDILPADDFGVREGYRHLKRLDTTPTPAQLRRIAEAWSPHRTVAAWYLWQLPRQAPVDHPSTRKPSRKPQPASDTTAQDDAPRQPSRARDKRTRTHLHVTIGQCSLGALLLARSERGLCALLLGDDPEQLSSELREQFPNATMAPSTTPEPLLAQVIGSIEAPASPPELPLDLQGTAFQLKVWQALREIPAGETVSYAELAERIGSPNSVRAVAGACAANRLAVFVPCHRVVRSDGSLSGYRWGVERKRELLRRERAAVP